MSIVDTMSTLHAIMPMSTRSAKLRSQPGTSRKLATKKKICDAAQSLFFEIGFEATTVDQIAAKAGMRRSTIYTHFKDKNEIFAELVNSVKQSVQSILDDIPSPSPTESEIHDWIKDFAKLASREKVLAGLLIRTGTSRQIPDSVVEFGDIFLQGLARHLPAFKRAKQSRLEMARARAVLRQLGWALVYYLEDPELGDSHLQVAGEWFNQFIRDYEQHTG